MDDMQQALMNSDVMYQEGLSPKKLLSKAGLALAILAAVVLGIQTIIEALVMNFQPTIADTDWYVWAVTAISLVVIGFPIYFLLMKMIPDSPKGPVVKLKTGRFIMIFFICVAAMYITNFFSTILTYVIAIIKGEELINPAAQAIMDGNFLITLVYAAIVAPIVEEMIFRKILLDKVRRFGDIPAILITGFAFGLFHLNLSQFFYATVLGFIFAYITLRTNTVFYSIILHMMINLLSTAITPFVTDMNMFVILGIIAWEFITIAAGIVFFVLNMKKIEIYKTAPVMKTSAYFLNAGTILYTLICIVIIIIMTVL
jgi:membrane protease YdiL (CAAX protease family)